MVEGEGVQGRVRTQERDGRARGRGMDREGAKQSQRGRLPLHSKRKSLRRAARSSHGRGQGAAKERRMGEGGAEVEAREKSLGGQEVVQRARRSQRDLVAGPGVRGGDREAGVNGDQEGHEADPAVGLADQEVGRKADQSRSKRRSRRSRSRSRSRSG